MQYISTRGGCQPKSFSEAVLDGLAPDGGLYLPMTVPNVSDKLGGWSKLDYQALAFEVFQLFVGDEINAADLKQLIKKSYASFDQQEITPLKKYADVHLLELFHGPTFAFKDVALQFLGNLFEHLLKQNQGHLNILGATSGDTGSAAINGVRGKQGISIFMLYPDGKVSSVQEKQMTTVLDENVVNVAVTGNFDDCQSMVKQVFSDLDFKQEFQLGAVNSINWARIMAQIVYYFYAYFRLSDNNTEQAISFAVPTGNFGDIYAGYVAKKMGLPIKDLVIGSNENDLLPKTLASGRYAPGEFQSTVSPSMDIQVSSNFERLLFDLCEQNPQQVSNKMRELADNNFFELSKTQHQNLLSNFSGYCVNTEETLACIKEYYANGLELDPHSAVGVVAAKRHGGVCICLATAHPAKFPTAFANATGEKPNVPASIKALDDLPTRNLNSVADANAIKGIIKAHLVAAES